MDRSPESQDARTLVQWLQDLDARIGQIEKQLGIDSRPARPHVDPAPVATRAEEEDALEFRIGEFVIAHVGIVVLVVGIAFLLVFPFASLPGGLLVGLGYALSAATLVAARFARRPFPHLVRDLLAGGLFLLYFTTLRLHFFSPEPIIADRAVETGLLSLAAIAAGLAAVRTRSVLLAALGLTLGYATAILSEQTYVLLAGVLLLAGLSAAGSIRFGWDKLLGCAMVLSYVAHVLWMIGNPILSGQLHLRTTPAAHLAFLLAYGVVFALPALLRPRGQEDEREIDVAHIFLSGVVGYGLYTLSSIAAYRLGAAPTQLLASGYFLILASVFWMWRRSRIATFIYAMLGYGALTVAIGLATQRPMVFVWLCWQSMLVLATALWFRSKFIVLANFMIYTGVLVAYLALDGRIGWLGVNFGVVALLSARVLNWQKSRLDLRTDFMRNCYLAVAFLILPYALTRLVPGEHVTLYWVGLAIVYYALSRVLRNKKYRWMALLTLLLTVLYAFVIGVTRLEPVYRIVSFMVLGTVLLGVSLVYTRLHRCRPKRDPGRSP